jgi:hypothetical protein
MESGGFIEIFVSQQLPFDFFHLHNIVGLAFSGRYIHDF